jgi:hypothetical protein
MRRIDKGFPGIALGNMKIIVRNMRKVTSRNPRRLAMKRIRGFKVAVLETCSKDGGSTR